MCCLPDVIPDEPPNLCREGPDDRVETSSNAGRLNHSVIPGIVTETHFSKRREAQFRTGRADTHLYTKRMLVPSRWMVPDDNHREHP
jgi:hypothetical protein